MAATKVNVLSPEIISVLEADALHYILDLWFKRKVKSQLKGFAQLIRGYETLGLYDDYRVRYYGT